MFVRREPKHIGLPVNSDFFDSSNNIINLAKSYSVDPDALMSSRTMKCTFEARFEARQGGRSSR